jgi:hypothetical protein
MGSHFAQHSDLLLNFLYSVQYKPGKRANGSQFGEGRLSLAAIVILIAFRLTLVITALSSLKYDIGIYVCIYIYL